MKIVILDNYAANPGDIDMSSWREIGDGAGGYCALEVYDRTAPEDVVERSKDAEIILTNKVIISDEVMEQLPKLRYIGILATGMNVVDLDAAKRRGIIVTNVPAYSTMSVAQMVFAHLLNITHHVAEHSKAVHEGRWEHSADFCFWDYPLQELDGKVIGIVGLGNTGMATARIALAFGMKVLAYTSKADLPMGMRKAESIEQVFAESDVLSLHCPLTPETEHIVNAERLALMKSSAIIINTGRGPLLDEAAVADALRSGRIAAVGVDVLTQEPPRNGSPLIGCPNCYITPHIAWATLAARQRLLEVARENIVKTLSPTLGTLSPTLSR